MLHNLKDPITIDLPHVLIVQVLIQARVIPIISQLPFHLILMNPKGICKNLFAEATLKLEMLILHLLMMLCQIIIFDFILILHCLEMHLSPCLAQILLVLEERFVCLGEDPWFSSVVQEPKSVNHN